MAHVGQKPALRPAGAFRLLLGLAQLDLGVFLLGDVAQRTGHTIDATVTIAQAQATVTHPAIDAVAAEGPILGGKKLGLAGQMFIHRIEIGL